MEAFLPTLAENTARFEKAVCAERNFDLIRHLLSTADGTAAVLYYLDGFVKEEHFEKILENLHKSDSHDPRTIFLPYAEVRVCEDAGQLPKLLLSGNAVCFFEGADAALLLDARYLPERSISEPESDRVLRGARDGFVETLTRNTALLRRRLRDPRLRMERFTVGTSSGTDVVLCYMEGTADGGLTEYMRKRLSSLQVDALCFGQQTLAEALIRRRWYNPFPKFRYTERPDALAAMLLEGKIAVFCDNTPQVMVLPTSIFEFMQESDDYYLPPLTATYLRFLRIIIFGVTLFLTPVWYLLVTHDSWIPGTLSILRVSGPYTVPLLLQLLLVEFLIDGLKLASLNTPNMLGNSLSIIGGLILGDLAVEIGWFLPEVILYMAFVAIANFAQSGYELGYAFKFLRILLLLFTAVLGLTGFCLGVAVCIALVATNRTIGGKRRYLAPLFPFQPQAALRLFFRMRK